MTEHRPTAPTIAELLNALDPDQPALADVTGRSWTGAELAALTGTVRDALHRLGVGAGARVGIVLPGGPALACSVLGVAATAACAPLNPTTPADELDRLLTDLRAAAVLVDASAPGAAAEVAQARGLPVLAVGMTDGGLRVDGPAGGGATPAPTLPGPADVALILHTSGTTARPKQVPLSHTNLLTSARNIAATLALGPDDRCLTVMPLFHIHGIVAALLAPLVAGGSLIAAPGFFAPEVPSWIDRCGATWFTAVPTMHQALLERFRADPGAVPRTRLRLVRSSSASLAPSVLAALEATLGCPVIEAYGMTEAAHQMASNPLPPGERRPGSVGPAAGPEVAVVDEHGRTLPAGEEGEVVIRGANVTAGYLDNPEANAEAFMPDGWFRTGDLGWLDPDGYLWLTGRRKEQINRAGEKISPREVDEVLLSHPAVRQAVTFAVPDERLGEQVAAAVVLRPGSTVTERELRELVHARLAPHKVPRRVLLVEDIPLGATGKLQRVGLADRFGLRDLDGAGGSADHTAPRDAIEELVAGLWSEVLGVDEVGVHTHFLDLGGDSMLATRLLSRLHAELELEISVLELFDRPTVAEQAQLVAALLAAADRPAGETAPR